MLNKILLSEKRNTLETKVFSEEHAFQIQIIPEKSNSAFVQESLVQEIRMASEFLTSAGRCGLIAVMRTVGNANPEAADSLINTL